MSFSPAPPRDWLPRNDTHHFFSPYTQGAPLHPAAARSRVRWYRESHRSTHRRRHPSSIVHRRRRRHRIFRRENSHISLTPTLTYLHLGTGSLSILFARRHIGNFALVIIHTFTLCRTVAIDRIASPFYAAEGTRLLRPFIRATGKQGRVVLLATI